jgi:thymidine phosphorylase
MAEATGSPSPPAGRSRPRAHNRAVFGTVVRRANSGRAIGLTGGTVKEIEFRTKHESDPKRNRAANGPNGRLVRINRRYGLAPQRRIS